MTEKKEMESFSEKDTFLIGKQFGTQAKAGDIYLLHGDLGVGKTVFTKGFAEGLGIEEPITSPTFTLIQEYMERYGLDGFETGRAKAIEEICTGSATWKKCMILGLTSICSETESA